MLSNQSLLKNFNWTFIFCFLCLSTCIKQQDSIVLIKVGTKTWTFKEFKNYFEMRVQSLSKEEKLPKEFKKKILKEVLIKSFIENWAQKKQKKIQDSSHKKDKNLTLKNKKKIKALIKYKNYHSLYKEFLEKLSNKTKHPPLKEQKEFFKKNKKLFYKEESCKLKQIVVKTKNLALTLHQKIKQGDSFDKINTFYSIQKNPGWIPKGSLKIFDKACLLDKNSLSPPLKSPYGWHIFFIEEKRKSKQKSFKEVQKIILYLLKEKEKEKEFQLWLKKEIDQTPVWINQKLLNTIHIQYKKQKL